MNTNLKFHFMCLLAMCYSQSRAGAGGATGPSVDTLTRLSAESLAHNQRMQIFSADALNLKGSISSQNSGQQMASSISLTETDINAISAVGNTWVLSIAPPRASFSMNIGIANNSSPQTWTLPANFKTNFTGAGRKDFIAPSSVPSALQITGATMPNRVIKSYLIDDSFNWVIRYDHLKITSTNVAHLGTSYDLQFGTDRNFDEPDFKFSDVPIYLGDTWTTSDDHKDYVSAFTLEKIVETITVDAYGTISTPDGTFNCLRMSYVTDKYTRPDESSSFALQSTKNSVGFITKEGYYFSTDVSATSGTANCTNFVYRKVVSTAALSETNDVKFNNDSKGVTINVDNSTANPSAILDVKSDSLGILIPRVTKANRPKTPVAGLLVYQIDNTPGFYYFDGTGWRVLGSSPSARVAAEEVSVKNGSSTLTNGSTFIKFDNHIEDFENVNIQIQAEGDCNGIFISNKTKEGFEVKELQKGKSNVKFSWKLN